MFKNLFKRQQPQKRRVAIIGLDCAAPELVFERWADELPNLSKLRQHGLYGELESVIPAITVPAWSCMMSSKDPGSLGVYGFRNRKDHSYNGMTVANSDAIHEPRLWDILSITDKQSIVLGVPGTYPPTPINGSMVSCFLTPSTDVDYTYPVSLKQDITNWVGDYMVDVKGFRTENKQWLLDQLREMAIKRFEVARNLLTSRPWDFFMMVEIGVDRMHHAFWKDMDATHRQHDPSTPFKDAIREYYHLIDHEIGILLPLFDDDTAVFVVSDHGAKKMDGGICINEWLIREGYLVLAEPPDTSKGAVKFEDLKVDWNKTRVWGDGGYYGRLFINLKDREPQGIVEPADFDALRDELINKLEALGDENGQAIGTRCFTPETLYQNSRGVAPDVLVYFGDLAWRSIGTVGWNSIHVFENDTGPDDANHAQQGMFIYNDPKHDFGGQRLTNSHLMQIAPTVLQLFDLPIPIDMQKPPIEAITRV
jgi:predicted AlkP superfamily phosphohydrolase/phosphomutase